jgi:heme-degrading monooxygenase HmoA
VALNKEDACQFLVIWEFLVRPGKEQLFEHIYGPDGDWEQLFRKGHGYYGTKLTRDPDEPRRYLTLDFWESQEDYERFKSQHTDEYKTIDAKCEALTEKERELGKLIVPRTGN